MPCPGTMPPDGRPERSVALHQSERFSPCFRGLQLIPQAGGNLPVHGAQRDQRQAGAVEDGWPIWPARYGASPPP